jgi:hypothetical protein
MAASCCAGHHCSIRTALLLRTILCVVQPTTRGMDRVFRLFRADELQAMSTGLNHHTAAPKPYSSQFPQVSVLNIDDRQQPTCSNRSPQFPFIQLQVQIPTSHPLRSMQAKEKVRTLFLQLVVRLSCPLEPNQLPWAHRA